MALVAIVVLMSPAGDLSAQAPSAEFGIDAAVQLSYPDGGERLTTVEIPVGRIRLGTYVSDHVLFEVSGGFALADQSGRTASAGRADAALSIHIGGDASKARPFILIGGGGRFARVDDATVGQGFVLGGLGLKVPVNRVVGVRLEVDYARAFETSLLDAAHEVRGLLGMSFFVGG